MESIIRPFRPNDLEVIKAITIEGFEGVSVEHGIELKFGEIAGHDWRWRKARHVDEDVKEHAAGIFIAEVDSEILGYISTRLDPKSGKGRIPNLAVAAGARGRGMGRKLIGHALEYFRAEGMGVVVIETMASNPIGQSLYPSCGFEEVGHQIHYACRL